MDYELIFYLSGIALALSAVVVTFLGLRVSNFPGKAAPIVVVWFVALVGLSSTFAVLHSQHEEEHHEEEVGLPQATEESEAEEAE
jgi:hypothetical protein